MLADLTTLTLAVSQRPAGGSTPVEQRQRGPLTSSHPHNGGYAPPAAPLCVTIFSGHRNKPVNDPEDWSQAMFYRALFYSLYDDSYRSNTLLIALLSCKHDNDMYVPLTFSAGYVQWVVTQKTSSCQCHQRASWWWKLPMRRFPRVSCTLNCNPQLSNCSHSAGWLWKSFRSTF